MIETNYGYLSFAAKGIDFHFEKNLEGLTYPVLKYFLSVQSFIISVVLILFLSNVCVVSNTDICDYIQLFIFSNYYKCHRRI